MFWNVQKGTGCSFSFHFQVITHGSYSSSYYATLGTRVLLRMVFIQVIRIETGRREGTPAEQRLCRLCSLNKVENKKHFLLESPVYQPLRVKLFLAFEKEIRTFHSFDNRQKFIYLMSCEDKKLLSEVAKYIRDAFKLRPNIPALIP